MELYAFKHDTRFKRKRTASMLSSLKRKFAKKQNFFQACVIKSKSEKCMQIEILHLVKNVFKQ